MPQKAVGFACLIALSGLTSAQQDPQAAYVGSKACANCHADIYRSYFQTPMGQASGAVAASPATQPPPGNFHQPSSGTDYQIAHDGSGLYLTYSKKLATGVGVAGRRELEFYIGSAAHARGYLFRQNGQLFQAPVAWYTAKGIWDMAPGYEHQSSILLGRKIEPTCLECHASGVSSDLSSSVAPFTEGAIACERCHGPGSEHLARFTSGHENAGLGIINPAKLSSIRRDSVCAQCHLTGEVRIQKSHTAPFRAGDLLSDHVVPFVWSAPDATRLKVIGHFEGLALSRCKIVSGERLWCVTCHNPHTVPKIADKATYFRGKCLTCHSESACQAPQPARLARADDCTACHMPKKQAVDGLHAAFTDHSIPRKTIAHQLAAGRSDLVPFWPGTATLREAALAWADVAWRSHADSDYRKAFETLTSAASSRDADPEVLADLGYLNDLSNKPAFAAELYQRSLDHDPRNKVALANLAQHLAVQGDLSGAVRLWGETVAIDPGLLTPALNLARAHLQSGQIELANKAVGSLLLFHPDSAKGLQLQSEIAIQLKEKRAESK